MSSKNYQYTDNVAFVSRYLNSSKYDIRKTESFRYNILERDIVFIVWNTSTNCCSYSDV